MFAAPSKAATRPLELYSFEGSPYVRLVREVLCELETTYIVRNMGKSPGAYAEFFPPIIRHNKMKNYMPATENRKKLIARAGKMMVPFIVDPNGTSRNTSGKPTAPEVAAHVATGRHGLPGQRGPNPERGLRSGVPPAPSWSRIPRRRSDGCRAPGTARSR